MTSQLSRKRDGSDWDIDSRSDFRSKQLWRLRCESGCSHSKSVLNPALKALRA